MTRLTATALLSTVCLAPAMAAEPFPTRPITFVLALGPGSSVETSARMIGQGMSQALGQRILIDFKPGASGAIGAKYVADQAPDGYTLLYTISSPIMMRPVMVKNVPYDPIKDFTPIGAIIKAQIMLIAHPRAQVSNLRELIEAAKKTPGKITYGTNGIGGSFHLMAEQFQTLAGIKLIHVPYKSGGPMAVDLLAGQIHVGITAADTVAPHIASGRLKPLVSMEEERDPAYPDVPSITEIVPKFQVMPGWTAMFGPAGMPREIVKRLEVEAFAAAKNPEVLKKFHATGQYFLGIPSEQFAPKIKRDIELIRSIARQHGLEGKS